MVEARRPKFRFAETRAENDPYMTVAIGYVLLHALINAVDFVFGVFFLLGGEPATPAHIVSILISPAFAYGFYWTALEVEARRKRGGYVLIGLVVLGALPMLGEGTAHLMSFVFTGLGALVVAMIWKYLE